MRLFGIAPLLVCTAAAPSARAEDGVVATTIQREPLGAPIVEIGLSGGAFFPSKSHALYDSSLTNASPAQTASFDMNLHLAVFPLEWVGAEIEGGLSPLRASSGEEAKVIFLRSHLILQLPGRVTPFILGGGGFVGSATSNQGYDFDRASHFGAGIKFDVTDLMMVRFDVRDIIDGRLSGTGGITMSFEAFAGVSFALFRREQEEPLPPPIVTAPPPPPKEELSQPPPVQVAVVEAERPMTIEEKVRQELDRVHFAWGKYHLRPNDLPSLERASVLLLKHPDIAIVINGHTDSTGALAYNLWLSKKRAEVVKSYLVKKGVSPDRLSVLGFGPYIPVDSNDTSQGRAANRRGEVKVRTVEEGSSQSATSGP